MTDATDLIERLRRLYVQNGTNYVQEAADEIERLTAELETERMRLAACGVVALANTEQSAAKEREMLPEYRSASLADVERAVDREMQLRAERDDLRRQLAGAEQTISDLQDALRTAVNAATGGDAMKQDARRYRDWLRGGANIPPESTRWPRWEVRHWDGRYWNTLFAEALDTSIDAAMGLTRPAEES